MNQTSTTPPKGFTIVELLIVIVIIGILTTITVVAYNGVSQRAQDATTLSLVNSWEKAIISYGLLKNIYPNITPASNRTYCLGSLPADSDYADNACKKVVVGTGSDSTRPSTELLPVFQAQGISTPPSIIKRVDFPGSTSTVGFRGIQLKTNYNTKTSYRIYYALVAARCKTGDDVAYEMQPSGVGIIGQSSPGTQGIAKLCIRDLPDLQ